ncbi:MAG: tRNA epoxyqueuosine(34) reductase QueG [Bacteroidetes bacterium]|nr:MAG: tRNA epoxyqueuosine(34) reductase QueG [Bacteroidota bacterium]
MKNKERHTHFLKKTARDLGFAFVGIAAARRLDAEAERLENWLKQGFQGKMSYMENHFDLRLDPTKLVPGARSVVSLMYNYFTDREQSDPEAPRIAKYAYGKDYHFLLKDKLKTLLQLLRAEVGEVEGRCFVDSAPVMERQWAQNSGLGWTGKNTLLIHPRAGSYFFLAELIIDLDLVPDAPLRDHCGTCTRCIDACPTDAISENGYLLDASKCISYLTIELRDETLPEAFRGKMKNYMFGCDICQQVCPWNKFSTRHAEPYFEPHPRLLDMTRREWEELTEDVFREVFRKSAVKRTKFKGLKRNIDFLKKRPSNE